MDSLQLFWTVALGAVFDITPIMAIALVFQLVVLRRRPAQLTSILWGLLYIIIGLTLFQIGLEMSLFPLGTMMAGQLVAPEFTGVVDDTVAWQRYLWLYAFAAALGFATTLVEPTLIATSTRVEDLSGGVLGAREMRITVALGVALGLACGTLRIVVGTPLPYLIGTVLLVIAVQSFLAPKWVLPLAYDSGAIATSVVTVPLIAALGLGVATAVPGRSPAIDGFSLVFMALIFPVITILGYMQLKMGYSKLRIRGG